MTNAFDPDRDSQIAGLLKLAGRRPAPGAGCLLRARDAARAEWRQVVQVRARRRLLRAIVAAAISGVAGGAAWMWAHRVAPVDRREIATVHKVIGAVRVSGGLDGPATLATSNGPIRSGDRLETGQGGGAALQVLDGPSIRLHAGTAVTFEAAGRLRLDRGTVYVDSDPQHARNHAPVVVTAFGNVHHLGTQFEVVLQGSGLDVRVREGAVSIESGSGRLSAAAGEALLVKADRTVERRRIATSGPGWAWTGTLAAPFTLEGSTVRAFLQWVSREEGLHWEYADGAARRVADRAVLHGSIEGLTPAEALLAVLPAAGLTSTRDGDRLIIRAAAG